MGDETVVADALPRVEENQPLPRRKNRFKKQIAVVVPLGAIASPVMTLDEVKPDFGRFPGEPVMVHTQQGDYLEGDAAHGDHGAKSYAAGKETMGETRDFKLRRKVLAYDRERQEISIAACFCRIGQIVNGHEEMPMIEKGIIVLVHAQKLFAEFG